MNKFFSVILLGACVFLSSCTKTAPNLFGTIPSIYESRIIKIAQKLHEMNQANGIGAGNDYVMEQAPLAFDSASVEALPQADKMIGMDVPATIDNELGYEFASKVKISAVELPTFDPRHSEPEKVTLEFDLENATDVARIYYFLCSADDTIHCAFADVLPVAEGKLHVTAEIKAPNIPAEYQEKITTFCIVSEETYGHTKLFVDADQKIWRNEYNERVNNRRNSALPVASKNE